MKKTTPPASAPWGTAEMETTAAEDDDDDHDVPHEDFPTPGTTAAWAQMNRRRGELLRRSFDDPEMTRAESDELQRLQRLSALALERAYRR